MSEPINVGEATFDQVVLQSELPVLVDFWAPWCGPCRTIAPVINELAQEYDGKLRVVKVNVDDAQQLAMEHRVLTIPSLRVFKGGKEVHEVGPLRSKQQLFDEIDQAIAAGA